MYNSTFKKKKKICIPSVIITFGTIQNTPEKYDMWAWSADSPMPCWFTLFALFTAETPSNQKLV